MTIPILKTFSLLSFAGQSDAGIGLGMDILIYIVIAAGFVIIGFLASNFYTKVRIKEMEAESDAEKERMNRRIKTLEKEIKHLYAKDDEQIVIINNLKKQLEDPNKNKSSKNKESNQNDDHLDLFSEAPED